VCTVCLEPVDPSGGLLKLPCQHCFHARCIGDWAYWASRRRPGVPATCPSCRAGMEAKVIEELQKLLGVEDLLVLPLMVFSLLASCAPSARLLDPRPHASRGHSPSRRCRDRLSRLSCRSTGWRPRRRRARRPATLHGWTMSRLTPSGAESSCSQTLSLSTPPRSPTQRRLSDSTNRRAMAEAKWPTCRRHSASCCRGNSQRLTVLAAPRNRTLEPFRLPALTAGLSHSRSRRTCSLPLLRLCKRIGMHALPPVVCQQLK